MIILEEKCLLLKLPHVTALTENIDQRWLVLRLTITILDYTQHFACDGNHLTALGIARTGCYIE
jgi:hypothetical protein